MTVLLKTYILLAIAIAAEIIGSSLLSTSEHFTRPIPTIGVIIFYCLSFYTLTFVIKVIPLGITYAIWSSVGIVALACISHFFLQQKIDLPAFIGISLIVIGVVIINIFSKSIAH